MNESIKRRQAENARAKLRVLRRIEKKRLEVQKIMGRGTRVTGMEQETDRGINILAMVCLGEEERRKEIAQAHVRAPKLEHINGEQNPDFAENVIIEIGRREEKRRRELRQL